MEPNVSFAGRDVINSYDFNNQELCHIMDTAMIYEKRVKSGEAIKDLDGMVVATLFFEPSTRTRLSFQAAINRVGASCIDLGNASVSSQSKGETWQDTLMTVDGYVDAIVMRHPTSGAAIEAADIAVHPLINGGDGSRKIKKEHLDQFDGKTEDELFKIGEDNIFKELDNDRLV